VAAEGISSLAERIEPIFGLDDVVLPADRSRQLVEIVDNVRLAARVLDGWKFGAQLPYGRGVSASFASAFKAAGGQVISLDPYLTETLTAGAGAEPYLRRALALRNWQRH